MFVAVKRLRSGVRNLLGVNKTNLLETESRWKWQTCPIYAKRNQAYIIHGIKSFIEKWIKRKKNTHFWLFEYRRKYPTFVQYLTVGHDVFGFWFTYIIKLRVKKYIAKRLTVKKLIRNGHECTMFSNFYTFLHITPRPRWKIRDTNRGTGAGQCYNRKTIWLQPSFLWLQHSTLTSALG